MSNRPPAPWDAFLRDIDEFVDEPTELHLLGGFVVTVLYGSTRPTQDIDALTARRHTPALLEHAGKGSPLHAKHKVYLDAVGIVNTPEDYADRLTEAFAGRYMNLRLLARASTT